MLTIYGADGSPFVRKVLVALAEKGVEYEHDPIIPFGLGDDYKAKHPLKKIPCLEDGDLVVPDSSAILGYLEKKYPTPALHPSDAGDYGRALWYEEYADTKLAEVLSVVFFERYVKKLMQQEPDESRCREALEQAPELFDYLEGEIGDKEFLVGDRFSIADISIASIFVNFGIAGEKPDASRWPNLTRYLADIHGRPSFKPYAEQMTA